MNYSSDIPANNTTPIINDAGKENLANQHNGWFKRNLFKLSIGALAVGSVGGYLANPSGHIEEQIIKTEAWAALGLVASEGVWIGGAVLMAKGAGIQFTDKPWEIKRNWKEIKKTPVDNYIFKTGLVANTIGALGTAGVVAVGATMALPEALKVPTIGWAVFDVASTLVVRGGIYKGMKLQSENLPTLNNISAGETKEEKKLKIRTANLQDIEELADLDLRLFSRAYGEEKPVREEVISKFTQRLENNPGWMFVATVNGGVKGFVTGFLTNTPAEDFVSWEKSTSNGTLEGKVEKKGRYVYVVNMTIDHDAVMIGAEEALLAQLFAKGIHAGAEYGYFVSRMPYFKRWVIKNKIEASEDEAIRYADMRNKRGMRVDPQLRMYEKYGFELSSPVKNAFQDKASLNFGVVCKAYGPASNAVIRNIPFLRWGVSFAIKQVAKNPKLLKKVM